MQPSADAAITAFAVASSLGCGAQRVGERVRAAQSGLRFDHRFSDSLRCPLGELPWDELGLRLGDPWHSDQLLLAGSRIIVDQLLRESQLLARHRAGRIGLYVGTTTCGVSGFFAAVAQSAAAAGLGAAESRTVELGAAMQQGLLADQLAAQCGIKGPVYTLSTSCAASAQALGLARDAVATGWLDAAVVVGADVLNPVTIHGFEALQILDHQTCRPFAPDRAGINLGEALVAAAVERVPAEAEASRILGYGALSEAYHMTQPAPEGAQMHRCMEKALRSAGVAAERIGYINPHGTGTPANDQAEALAIEALFGAGAPLHPTKALTGHTLGACGLLETLISVLSLKAEAPSARRLALNNSFGFGGANVSLVLQEGRA